MGKKKKKHLRVSDPNFVCQDRVSFTGSFDLYITRNIRKRYSGVIINENTEGSFKVLIETSYAYHAAPRTLQAGASIELRDFPLSRIVFQGSGIFTVLVWASERPEAFVRTTVPLPVSVTVQPTDQNIIKWGGTLLTGRDITGDLAKLQNLAITPSLEHILANSFHSVRITDGSAFLDPRAIRSLTAADITTVDSLTKWGGTPLTGRDISIDFKWADWIRKRVNDGYGRSQRVYNSTAAGGYCIVRMANPAASGKIGVLYYSAVRCAGGPVAMDIVDDGVIGSDAGGIGTLTNPYIGASTASVMTITKSASFTTTPTRFLVSFADASGAIFSAPPLFPIILPENKYLCIIGYNLSGSTTNVVIGWGWVEVSAIP